MTTIQGSGGSLYPIEQTTQTAPIVKKQENTQDSNNVCNVPQINKKENVPYPLLSGIEEQLDQSFKEFKGSLKEAKEKSNIVLSQNNGNETGLATGIIKGNSAFINPSVDINIEGQNVTRIQP